jgi:hypothetical protein
VQIVEGVKTRQTDVMRDKISEIVEEDDSYSDSEEGSADYLSEFDESADESLIS